MPNTTVPAAGEAMPAAINITLNPRDRLTLSTTIEQLINMLDELSPDPDLEPWLGEGLEGAAEDEGERDEADEEPTLGAPENHPTAPRWCFSMHRSREGSHSAWYQPSKAIGEDEPSFGANASAPHSADSPWGRSGVETRTHVGSQERWCNGYDRADTEHEEENEHGAQDSGYGDEDGMSVEHVGEPSLGWPEQINQESRGKIKPGWFAEDGEQECEDEGAQCDDEGALEHDGPIQWSDDPAVSQDSLEWRGAW